MRTLTLLLALTTLANSATIERRGAGDWPTRNHQRIAMTIRAARGVPVLASEKLPPGFNPDSVRVIGPDSTSIISCKTEWRTPTAEVSWISRGPGAYFIYFDTGREGETERLAAPAMVGTGDPITYGRGGVHGALGVGLWAHPAVLDFDGDGNLDIIVSSVSSSHNGTFLFRNLGTNEKPLFDRAEWLGKGGAGMVAADFNGDGATDLVTSGGYYSDVRKNRLSAWVPVKLPRNYWIGRDDYWYPVDWDGDGKIDVLAGVSDWRDYGWDDAFNEKGEWTRGGLHGYVYFHRNTGTNAEPRYAEPVLIEADGKPIDQYGSPVPNPVDWLGTGKLDLVATDFIDTITLFRNRGTRTAPRLAAGELLRAGGQTLHMDLCMIQPRVVAWHKDGRPSLVIGEEDGRVALLENRAPRGQEPEFAPPRYLEQVDPYLKSGALSRPVAVDWNGDGKLDLLSGNSAGYIQFFENTGTNAAPVFADRGYLKAAGKTIRRMAGPNGSVQGPAETKWGYTNISVADWDLDGKLDILVNDIWGSVMWYRNTGTAKQPELAAAQPVEVEWPSVPPKPDWVWWKPQGKQLVTQWRTTPAVVDWDRDGLPDLVMLDHRGYVSLYRRARRDGTLVLLPPERIFVEPGGRFLNLAAGRGGASGRRKINVVDWDGDGDLDLVTDGPDGPVWYENTGTQQKPVMKLRGALLKTKLRGHNPTPYVVDWNGDGKPDLIVGTQDGFFYYSDRNYLDAN
jgi:FG-GAP-like repeat